MLLLIMLVLLVLAIGGGIIVSKFLFLLLLVAIAVAIFSRMGSRSTSWTPPFRRAVNGGKRVGISFRLIRAAVGGAIDLGRQRPGQRRQHRHDRVILLIVGIIGFATSIFFWSSWGGFARTAGGANPPTSTAPPHA